MKRKKLSKGFIDFVLFHPQAYSILLAMSFIMAFFVCGSVFLIGLKYEIWILTITFGVLTLFSIYNIYKYKHLFKVFRKGREVYIDLTVADALNTTFASKDMKKEEGIKSTIEEKEKEKKKEEE